MSSAGHTEKSLSFNGQEIHNVVEETENFRVTRRCWCSTMYRVCGRRERRRLSPSAEVGLFLREADV